MTCLLHHSESLKLLNYSVKKFYPWKHKNFMISLYKSRTGYYKMWPYPTYFLDHMYVSAFVGLPWCVCQHTNRTKVHLNGLGRLNCVNTELISFQNLKSMFAKRVPRMDWCSPGLQYWSHNHILPISCVWEHHIGSLKRAKVLLISKLCFVTRIWSLDNINFVSKMIKIVPKWWKFIDYPMFCDNYTL